MKDPHKNRSVPPCFAVDSLLFLAVLVKRIVNYRVNPVVQHTSSRNLSAFITMKNIDDHNEKAVLRFLVCIAANCCGEAIEGWPNNTLTDARFDRRPVMNEQNDTSFDIFRLFCSLSLVSCF